MAFCECGTGKIYYSVHGKGNGKPLVMLRGLGRSSRYWLGFEKEMAKHFRVVLIDLRGLGQSTTAMGWNTRVEDLADDCLTVLTKAKIKKFHMFGLSLGGMVAMAMAIQAPARVQSLIVSSSSSADYLGFRLNPLIVPRLLIGGLRGNFHGALMQTLVAPTVLRSRQPEIAEAWSAIREAEGFPLLAIVQQIWAAGRFRLAKRLDAEKVPTMFVHGGLDGFVPQWNSKQLHRLVKGSEFRSIKSSGHEIAMGHEKELSKVIRDFVKAAG